MILITGGTGFLGRYLVNSLIEEGRRVRVLAREGSKVKSLKKLGAEIFYGDVTDYSSVESAVKNCSIVYHLAALLNYYMSYEELAKVNVFGTENVLNAAKRARIKKFIHCSSVAVEGKTTYGRSKLEGEKLALKYSKQIPVIIVRPAPIYGRGSDIWYELLSFIEKGFGIIGKSERAVHMAHVKNTVLGLELAEKKGKVGQIYTIADERALNAGVLFGIITKELGIKEKRTPYLLAYVYALYSELKYRITGQIPKLTRDYLEVLTLDRKYDISKAKIELGYNPKISVEKGIKDLVDWYLSTK